MEHQQHHQSLESPSKSRPRVCPKTGKNIGAEPVRPQFFKGWKKWLFPISGLIALIWFLVRVIPKPSRAAYPCQRAAFPVAASLPGEALQLRHRLRQWVAAPM